MVNLNRRNFIKNSILLSATCSLPGYLDAFSFVKDRSNITHFFIDKEFSNIKFDSFVNPKLTKIYEINNDISSIYLELVSDLRNLDVNMAGLTGKTSYFILQTLAADFRKRQVYLSNDSFSNFNINVLTDKTIYSWVIA